MSMKEDWGMGLNTLIEFFSSISLSFCAAGRSKSCLTIVQLIDAHI